MIASTPSAIPPDRSPALNRGVMTSRMIRPDMMSVMRSCSPRAVWTRMRRSLGATRSSRPFSVSAPPISQSSARRCAYGSISMPSSDGTVATMIARPVVRL